MKFIRFYWVNWWPLLIGSIAVCMGLYVLRWDEFRTVTPYLLVLNAGCFTGCWFNFKKRNP